MTVYDELELKVSQISYKPGWKFNIIYQCDLVQLFMTFKTQDINSRDMVWLSKYVGVSPLQIKVMLEHEKLFISWITNIITDMEIHERDEWLKFKGVQIRDPHPELEKRVG